MLFDEDMTVKEQREITDEFLDKIYFLSPSLIVAGGAPRDWYFGNLANDIDIFFHREDLKATHLIRSLFGKLDIKLEELGEFSAWKENYNKNPLIYKVFETTYKGINFQLIQTNDTTYFNVVESFPLNLCRAWYKNGKINLYPEFEIGIKTKSLVKLSPLYADGQSYITKIRNKFPDYDYYSSLEGFYKDLDRIIERLNNDNKNI